MANGGRTAILPQIHRIFHVGTLAGATDGELLARFAAEGDEAAFDALLARHGPMVLGVCRSLLRDPADAEDAFQATLLVLVRKARSIQLDDSLAPWIYGVATRVAHRARSNAARRVSRERADATIEPAAPSRDLDRLDLAPILHEELALLPERLRAPIVLCHLEGLTHELAAERLRCPIGTVRSRLARGRDRLRTRLTRRGVTLTAGGLAAALGEATAGAVPSALFESTIQAATCVAAGRAALAGVLSAPVAALMEGVLHAMGWTKLKAAAGAAVVAGIVASGVLAQVERKTDAPKGELNPVAPAPSVPDESVTRSNATAEHRGSPLTIMRDPKELAIEAGLNRPVTVKLANEPLRKALQSLSEISGAEIVMDPRALVETDVTMATPVNLVASDIKLKNALKLMLNPLRLAYTVEDEVVLIRSQKAIAQARAFVKTYYVGDLLNHLSPFQQLPPPENRAKVGMAPIIEFITASVAPGTWNVLGSDGTPSTEHVEGAAEGHGIGSITPFYLSLSVIVRQTPEVHDELAKRLRQLRKLMDTSANQAAAESKEKTAPAPAKPASARTGRARELLDELEKEIDGLIRERDRLKQGNAAKPSAAQSRLIEETRRDEVSYFNFAIGTTR